MEARRIQNEDVLLRVHNRRAGIGRSSIIFLPRPVLASLLRGVGGVC